MMALPNSQYVAAEVLTAADPAVRRGSALRGRRLMLMLIVMGMFVNYLDRGNLAIAAPLLQRALNLNTAQLGVLFSSLAWTYLLCIPFAGALLDRLGPR